MKAQSQLLQSESKTVALEKVCTGYQESPSCGADRPPLGQGSFDFKICVGEFQMTGFLKNMFSTLPVLSFFAADKQSKVLALSARRTTQRMDLNGDGSLDLREFLGYGPDLPAPDGA